MEEEEEDFESKDILNRINNLSELHQSGGRGISVGTRGPIKHNLLIRNSKVQGNPVRVLRSSKEKRSSYAPDSKADEYRYDGIYCIDKVLDENWCSCLVNALHEVYRFLFVRCDKAPAPWQLIARVMGL